ncbi:hypothetical protein [Enterobacter asburiae]|uniref:hypothetical protein n=1 Tax=Enterobacter asburiae TaxID=61645 RepID=UPI0021CE81ED|nr:hypothetical protein [Enterobacter asburiae]MCU6243793.1 hypothetical protein [Enterobacter asburiae]
MPDEKSTQPLKYGDTVNIINNYNGKSGFLSVYDFRFGVDKPTSGTKHDVCTLDGSYSYGKIWRIESGIGKKTGCNVVDGDIIQLQNLYQCDGGYLECCGSASSGGGGASEIYQIHTNPLAGEIHPQSHQQWRVNMIAKTADGVLKNDDLFLLENQYVQNGRDAGVLAIYGSAGKAPALNNVFTSNNHSSEVASWQMKKVANPCPDLPSRDGPNEGCSGGDTKPLPIPGLLKKTQFTVTLINNEDWVRTATLNIDGKDQTLEVAGHKAISKAFTTETGVVTIALVDSQKGTMRIPSDINVLPMGATGKTMGFGAEKPSDEVRPAFMDVFVHIDWDTLINN